MINFFVQGASLTNIDAEGDSVLTSAAKYGRLEIIKWLLNKTKNNIQQQLYEIFFLNLFIFNFIHKRLSKLCYNSPLHCAARYGHFDCLKFMINELSIDLNGRDGSIIGDTILLSAVRGNRPEIVKYVIEIGLFCYC